MRFHTLKLQVMEEIIQRTANAMVAEGKSFQGVLFAGLMIKDGKVCFSQRCHLKKRFVFHFGCAFEIIVIVKRQLNFPRGDGNNFKELPRQRMPVILERDSAWSFGGLNWQAFMLLPLSRTSVQAKLLEHNVRFGDPECQCLMMRLETDLLRVLLSAASGQLHNIELSWSPEPALCVIMATQGYPGAYEKSTPIKGLEAITDAKVILSFSRIYNES